MCREHGGKQEWAAETDLRELPLLRKRRGYTGRGLQGWVQGEGSTHRHRPEPQPELPREKSCEAHASVYQSR